MKTNSRLAQITSICREQIFVAKMAQLVFQMKENIVGKGENAGSQNFLLSQQFFLKSLLPQNHQNIEQIGKELHPTYFTHYHTMPHFDALQIYSCGKHCEKREIACNKQFLLCLQCFLHYRALIFHFKFTLKCRL